MYKMADVEFDFDKSKAKYFSLVNKLFEIDSTHSESTISKTIEILKGPVNTRLHKNYEVSHEFGRDVLLEKKKTPTDENVHIQVLTFEDVFDIFMKYHTINNHLGGKRHLLQVEKQLKQRCSYPSICLTLLVKSCNVCNSKSKAIAKGQTKVGYVFVTVMLQKTISTIFEYLLIYLDKATDFIFLRPMRQKSVVEIAQEIFKIIMMIGPPQKICFHGYHVNAYERVALMLRQVCPNSFSFAVEYSTVNYDPTAYVIRMLHDWMAKNRTHSWEVGCTVVQRQLNMSPKTKNGEQITPHKLFYGTEMNVRKQSNRLKKKSKGKRGNKNQSKKSLNDLNVPSRFHLESDRSVTSFSDLVNDSEELFTVKEELMELDIDPLVEERSEDSSEQVKKTHRDKIILKKETADTKLENTYAKTLVKPQPEESGADDFTMDDVFVIEPDDENMETHVDPLNVEDEFILS